MTAYLLLLLTLCLPGTGSTGVMVADHLKPQPPRVYAVELRGQLGGYCVEQSTYSAALGRRVLVFTSRTILRTGPSGPGGAGTSVYDATYWIDPDTGKVWRARVTYHQGNALETREAEFENGRAVFRTIDREGSKSTQEIQLPEGVLVPYGMAFPALELMNTGRSVASLELFRMRDGKVHTLEIRKEETETIEFHGKSYSCHRMSLTEEKQLQPAKLWVTAAGELVKMVRPVEGMGFEPANPEVAGKIARASPRTFAFAPVDLKIANRAALTYLSLEAVLEDSGLEGAVASLNTGNQTFEGALIEGRIEGVFRVRSFYYGGGRPAAFPAGAEEAVALAGFLTPEKGSEGAGSLIQTRAREITKGLEQRWHAAHALGVWVRTNIAVDPFAEASPLEALERGKTSSEGIARLHVSLCRCLGIPARIVEGGIYLKTEKGGGFANHTWSEVYVGEDGWIPIDVASGQLNFLDAGHIRTGPAGSFSPVSVKILDYIPKPPENRDPVEVCRTDFPLAAGEVHRFAHYFDGEQIGIERITFIGEEEVEGGTAYRFTSELELKSIQGMTTTLAGCGGRLHYYESDTGESQRTYRVEGDDVHCERVFQDKTDKRDVRLPGEGFFFDNQQVFQMGFLVSRLSLEEGRPTQVDVFHPLSYRTLPIQVERLGRRVEEIEGRAMEVDVIELRSGFQRMILYMADSGLVVKELEQGGRAVAVWLGPE